MRYFKNAVFTAAVIFLPFLNTSAYAQQILDTPPSGTIRTAAEWEEIQALVVTWRDFKPVLAEIIRYAQEECKVIVHTTDIVTTQSELTNTYGVAIGPNIQFIQQPSNTLWIRDYGANTAYLNDVDSLFLVDWKYNRPSRVQDDTIPRAYARALNLNLLETTLAPNRLVHTGGNYMSDGFGTAFSSKLILDENTDKSESQINSIMQNYMGINRYIKMETLPYDGIHHIDMHMKLLDEETILMSQYPAGVADGPQIEANLLYVLDNFNSVFGTPYKVVRIISPPDAGNDYPDNNGDYRTYSNSVFVNKTVLLPVYSQQFDTTALRIYRENLPGYRVIGIPCNSIIAQSGAIHCITHSVGVNNPLLISHQQYSDTYDTQNPYQINAKILHRDGIATAKLYFRTDTLLPFTELQMTLTDTINNIWNSAIPPQTGGIRVHYYIYALANDGKMQVRPITAPTGGFAFNVLDVNTVGINLGALITGLFTVSAFPNPSSGLTCIPVFTSGPVKIELAVYDITGRIIQYVFSGESTAGENRFYINSGSWSPGIYIIKASTAAGFKTQKLIVN